MKDNIWDYIKLIFQVWVQIAGNMIIKLSEVSFD